MKKYIYVVLIFLLFGSVANANTLQEDKSIEHKVLTPKLDTFVGKYGYVDEHDKWIIQPSFLIAREFSEGFATVSFEERDSQNIQSIKRGYINTLGEIVFSKTFEDCYDFKDGYAAVIDEKSKVSIIDKSGKVVLKTNYYYHGKATHGMPVIEGIHTIIGDKPNGTGKQPLYGYITNDLKLYKPIFGSSPEYYQSSESKESMLIATSVQPDSSEVIRYLINNNLEPIKLPGEIASINEGIALIRCKDNTFAYVDNEGNIFDEIYSSKTGRNHKFVYAKEFSEGFAVVGVFGILTDPYDDEIMSYGYLNKDGTVFKAPTYLSANSFKEGLAGVRESPGSTYGIAILKTDGEYLLRPQVRKEIKATDKDKEFMTIPLHNTAEYNYVKSEVKKIVNQVTNSGMSDLDKLKAIHKYVLDNTKYSFAMALSPTPLGLNDYFEAIGILSKGRAVCSGYTKLLGLLLTEAGIECNYVGGETPMGSHSWNLVKIDGNYYHIDATWDDKKGPNKYYLVSDDYMKESRKWDYSNFPACPKGYYNDEWQPK